MLVDLVNLAIGHDPSLAVIQPSLLILEDYAVKFRYPGMNATVAQARTALQALRVVRRQIRKRLGI